MTTIPSRHQNKVSSGRQGRKTFNGQKTLKRVGGKLLLVEAIGVEMGKPLCHTREETTTNKMGPTTWDLGSTCTPKSSGAQRG